jgi:hypothetical protein
LERPNCDANCRFAQRRDGDLDRLASDDDIAGASADELAAEYETGAGRAKLL